MSSDPAPALSLGIAGSVPADIVREVAVAAEQAGLHALWINDTPAGDALTGIAAAAEVTRTLRLATGVVPLDRVPARQLADRVAHLGIPRDRLVLGVGSGAARAPLGLMREGLEQLRQLEVPLVLGALGPAMRRLGAQQADGLLLSWLTPQSAAAARDQAVADAAAGGASNPRLVLYTRTAVDPDAMPRLERESAQYAGFPNYAANFARLGHSSLDSTIRAADDAALAAGIAAYAGATDELVLRAITVDDSAEAITRLIGAAARARTMTARPSA